MRRGRSCRQHQLDIAQTEYSAFSRCFWQDNRLPITFKLRIYRSAVSTTLTHACEAWTLTSNVQQKINGFNSRCLHIITGDSYRNTATKPVFNLVRAIRRRRFKYLGHVLRMHPDRLIRQTLLAYVNGPNGAPDGSLLDDCQGKSSINSLTSLAYDRKGWQRFMNKCVV